MTERIQQALKFFTDKGLSKVAAAGIVGNLLQESGLRPDAINPGDGNDGSDSIGVAQWNGDRASNLRSFAMARAADSGDFITQLEFYWHELNTTERATLERLMAAQTVEEATAAAIGYERPQGWSEANPQGGHGWDRRLNFARQALGMDGLPLPEPTGTPVFSVPNTFSATAAPEPDDMYAPVSAEEAGASFWEGVKDAAGDWAGVWAYRQLALAGRAIDPTFTPDIREFEKERAPLIPPDLQDYVLEAGSAEDYEARTKWAIERAEQDRRLANAGLGAKAAHLITSMLDPSAIPLAILTDGAAAPLLAAAKLGRAGRILWGAVAVGAENAAFEAASSAVNPTIDLSDPIVAFGVGAVLGGSFGALRRAHPEEAALIARSGEKVLEKIERETLASTSPGSLGAAVNTEYLAPILSDTPILSVDDVPSSAINGFFRPDAAGQGLRSNSAVMRLVTAHTVADPVGLRGVSAAPQAVSITAARNVDRMNYRWDSVLRPAFKQWLRETGRGWRNRDRNFDEFTTLVADAVMTRTPDPNTSKHVLRAAAEFRAIMADYVERFENPLRDRGGVGRPIALLQKDDHYVPRMPDHDAIVAMVNKYGEQRMVSFIRAAILAKTPEMDPGLALRVAQGYLTVLRKAGLGMLDKVDLAMSAGSKEELREAFTDRLTGRLMHLSDQDLDAIIEAIVSVKPKDGGDTSGIGARFKRRTLLDYEYTDGELSMKDLFEKRADVIMRRYIRQAEGRIAFAQMQIRDPKTGELIINGVTSRAEWDKVINMVKDDHGRLGKSHKEQVEGISTDEANLQFFWDAINGLPHYNNATRTISWMRRLSAFNFIRLMANMGINQVQEFSRAFGQIGLKAMMSQMPALRRILDPSGRSIPRSDELLEELQAGTGLGAEMDFGQFRFRYEDELVGSQQYGRVGRGIDRLLLKGREITAHASLMTHIQAIQQKWVAKAASQKLYNMARRLRTKDGDFDLSRLRGKDRERLQDLGFDEAGAKRLFETMLAKGTKEDESRLVRLNLDQWDPAVREGFLNAIYKMTHRIIHKNDVGSLHRWMSHPAAQLMTQFRAFIIGSWAKATLHNLAHMDFRTFTTMMLELMAAAATYAYVTYMRSSGREDQDEYLRENLSLEKIATAGFARAAFMSVIPATIDSALTWTPVGPIFAHSRTSGSASDAIFGNPSVDLLNTAQRFTRGMLTAAVEGEEPTQGTVQSGLRLSPWGNFLSFMPLINLMTDSLPERH